MRRLLKRIDIFLWLRHDYDHLSWRERWVLAGLMEDFGACLRGERRPSDLM